MTRRLATPLIAAVAGERRCTRPRRVFCRAAAIDLARFNAAPCCGNGGSAAGLRRLKFRPRFASSIYANCRFAPAFQRFKCPARSFFSFVLSFIDGVVSKQTRLVILSIVMLILSLFT